MTGTTLSGDRTVNSSAQCHTKAGVSSTREMEWFRAVHYWKMKGFLISHLVPVFFVALATT